MRTLLRKGSSVVLTSLSRLFIIALLSGLAMGVQNYSFSAAAAALAAVANADLEVLFATTRSCSSGFSEDYRDFGCNTCIDPPLGMSTSFSSDTAGVR